MPVTVRIIGLVGGGTSPFDGLYLVDYDPTRPGTAPNGQRLSAHIEVTDDRAKARRFDGPVEAHAYWRTESGRPYPMNRPLTAFMIDVESLSA